MIVALPADARFSLDTNCIVTAWRMNYPPHMRVFDPIWNHLAQQIGGGIVIATSVVHRELTKKDDEVLAWCNARPDMFLDLVPELGDRVTQIQRDYPKILKGNRNEADPFVIGLAQLRNPPLTVVTQEQLGAANDNRPNIPFICNRLGVPYCNLLTMLRDTGL